MAQINTKALKGLSEGEVGVVVSNVERRLQGKRITHYVNGRFSKRASRAFSRFLNDNPSLKNRVQNIIEAKSRALDLGFKDLGEAIAAQGFAKSKAGIGKGKVSKTATASLGPKVNTFKVGPQVVKVEKAPLKEVQLAKDPGFIGRLRRQREIIRTKKERGKKLTLAEEGKLAGLTFVQTVSEFGKSVVELPKTAVTLAKNPSQLKEIPRNIDASGKEFGRLLRVSPTEAFVKIGTEIFLLKATDEGLRAVGKVGNNAYNKLNPYLKTVERGSLNLEVKSLRGGKKKLNIKVGGPVSKIKESLGKQARLAGKRVTAVSAQADRLIKLVKNKKIIRKPIPGENLLKPATRKLLKKFDEGKLTKTQSVLLDRKIVLETKGQGRLLERSFYADPRGRFRPSRLGLQKPKRANLLDVLSGDVTYRTNKPQILVFPEASIQAFPARLKGVARKLKKGKPLTKEEVLALQEFQLMRSGRFKPIGQLTKEPEITLAPGETVKRVKKLGTAVIDGKRVEIVQAKVVKLTAAERKALTEAKRLARKRSLTTVERKTLNKFKKKLEKKTGFKVSTSRSSRAKPLARRKKIVPRVKRIRKISRRSKVKRPVARRKKTVRKAPRKKTPVRRSTVKRPVRPTATRPTATRPTATRPTATRRSSTRKAPPRKAPPRAPPRIKRLPKTAKGLLKKGSKKVKKVKKKKKVGGYNVYAKPVRGRKLRKVNKVPLRKNRAEDLRNYIADTSLSRSARLVPTTAKAKKAVLKVPTGYGRKTKKKFRTFRQRNKKRRMLPKGAVIERGKHLLDTKQEKRKITLARRIKQITPKRVKKKKTARKKTRRKIVKKKTMKRKKVKNRISRGIFG